MDQLVESTMCRRGRHNRKHWRLGAALVLLLLAGGCGFLDDEPELEAFFFEAREHGEEFDASVEATGLRAGIAIVGQLNTPTPCTNLSGDLDSSGSQLTLRITARTTTSECEQIVGNFRYQGTIRGVDAGTYQLRVRHVFEGSTWSTEEFTKSVTVD